MIYENIEKLDNIIRPLLFNYNSINGPFVEIFKSRFESHGVVFRDSDSGEVLHSGNIGKGCWISCNYKYFKNIQLEISTGESTFVNRIDYSKSKILVSIDSKSLGDNLAWMPYVEEFRKKLGCRVVCSTFHNRFFITEYPEIDFIEPGTVTHGIAAQYNIGWYYDANGNIDSYRCPNNFRLQPMQKTASDILGLEYKQIKPLLKLEEKERENIVSIAIHGTAQPKYWNNSSGWQEVVDFLKYRGYRVLLISSEGDGYMGNYHPKGVEKVEQGPIENIIDILQKSKLFIGIGSGLSWLSWATNTPTCIISGFSFDYTEPLGDGVIRISTPEGKCTGCFNTHRLDPGDWNWCPVHKGTERQFECTKSITSDMVIGKIKKLVPNLSSKRGYVFYTNKKYFEIAKKSVEAIRTFSDLPIYVYLLDFYETIDLKDVNTIFWKCDLTESENMYHINSDNFLINRINRDIYKILIQRPLVVKDALEKYLDCVAYVDSDSVATSYVDTIFDYYDEDLDFPYFVEGVYDYLLLNGRGGAMSKDDLSTTLEHPACELFSVNQKVRERYRQSGYFVAGKNTISFLEEWYEMCIHPEVLEKNDYYAPYNEETIVNVLLWKRGILEGLPNIYSNGSLDTIDKIFFELGFNENGLLDSNWLRVPNSKEKLIFIHGEKNTETMSKMIEKLKTLK